jgi:hypothetical protein
MTVHPAAPAARRQQRQILDQLRQGLAEHYLLRGDLAIKTSPTIWASRIAPSPATSRLDQHHTGEFR